MIHELPIFSTLEAARQHLGGWLREHPEVRPEQGTLRTLTLDRGKTGYRYRFEVEEKRDDARKTVDGNGVEGRRARTSGRDDKRMSG